MRDETYEWAPEDIRSLFIYIEGKICIKCIKCELYRTITTVDFIKRKFLRGQEVRMCRHCLSRNPIKSRTLSRPEEVTLDCRLDPESYRKEKGNLIVNKWCTLCGKYKPIRVSSLIDCLNKGKRAPQGCKDCRMSGYTYTSSGYILKMQKDHPNASKYGYVPLHRLVMEKKLGRFLTNEETVHHINGDRADNDINNLQIRRGNHGAGQVYQCGDCQSHNVIAVAIAD